MTINPTLRAKVIELYLQKRGRNEIASSLSISQGSVSNILRAYKSKSESTIISDTSLGQNCSQISNEHTTCAEDISTESQTISNVDSSKVTPQEFESFISNDNASISIGVNINNTGSPVLINSRRPGVGKAVTTNTNWSANSNIVIPRDGGPFSHLGEDTKVITPVTLPSQAAQAPTSKPELEPRDVVTSQPSADVEDIDFDDNSYPNSDPYDIYTATAHTPDADAEYDPTYDGDPSNTLQKGWDSEPETSERRIQTTVRPTRQLEIQDQNAAPEEEFEQSQSQPSLLSDPANTLVDWDSDETWQRRFFKLMDERRRREEQIRLMDQKRQELEVEKRSAGAQLMYNLDQQKKALEARETKLFEVEDLIPSAKYLKDIGISFDQALVWIDCIREKVEIERIDLRTAAWKLAQDLRSYKDLGGLSKAIQDATQQLAMLNMVNEQQKRVIAVLHKAGMTEAKLVARLNSSTGVGIGVGVGQGNGGNNTTNNSNNDPNIILKLDDKLNLYP
jgi:hypothetical protein